MTGAIQDGQIMQFICGVLSPATRECYIRTAFVLNIVTLIMFLPLVVFIGSLMSCVAKNRSGRDAVYIKCGVFLSVMALAVMGMRYFVHGYNIRVEL